MVSLIKIYSPTNLLEISNILITFPWAGGNASYYRTWKETCISQNIALYSISLPSTRGMKMKNIEKHQNCYQKNEINGNKWIYNSHTIQTISEEIFQLLIKYDILVKYTKCTKCASTSSNMNNNNIGYQPITSLILFGHSFGALLAYEVCRLIILADNSCNIHCYHCNNRKHIDMIDDTTSYTVHTTDTHIDIDKMENSSSSTSCDYNTNKHNDHNEYKQIYISLHVSGMFDPYTLSQMNQNIRYNKNNNVLCMTRDPLQSISSSSRYKDGNVLDKWSKWACQSDDVFYNYLQTLGGIPDTITKDVYIECFLPSIRYDYSIFESYIHTHSTIINSKTKTTCINNNNDILNTNINNTCIYNPDPHSHIVFSLYTYVGMCDAMIDSYNMSNWTVILNEIEGNASLSNNCNTNNDISHTNNNNIGNMLPNISATSSNNYKHIVIGDEYMHIGVGCNNNRKHDQLQSQKSQLSQSPLRPLPQHNHFYLCNDKVSNQRLIQQILSLSHIQ